MNRQRDRATVSHTRGGAVYLTLLDSHRTKISGEIASVGDKCLELFMPVNERSSICRLMTDPVIGEGIRLDVYHGELIGFYVDIPYPYIRQQVRIKEGRVTVTY